MAHDQPVSFHPLEYPPPRYRGVGVPRRFGVGVLMILITMAALLFALMESLGTPAGVFVFVTVFFVSVAAGQALLFGGRRPRAASIVVGACLFPSVFLAGMLYFAIAEPRGRFFDGSLVIGLVCFIPLGAFFGYLAGLLIAVIFLFLQSYVKDPKDSAGPPLQLQPFTEADIDVLISWTKSRWVFLYWASMDFSYPLDRQQVQQHLQLAEGERPQLRAFKAVCPRTQRPLGYVELNRINWYARNARVGHALIDPAVSDRGRLCVELLEAVMDVAFNEMKLHRVEAIGLASDPATKDHYRKLGFREEGRLRNAVRFNGIYRTVWILSKLVPDVE